MSNTTNGITNAEGARVYDPSKPRTVNNELGKNEFLQVLVAQMSYQDPLNPTNDTEFIAQMAQFSALEQMTNVSTAVNTQMVYSMIGKDVVASSVVDSDGISYSAEVYGSVTGITKLGGVEYLRVFDYNTSAEYLVPPSSVVQTFQGVTSQDQLLTIYELLQQIKDAVVPAEETLL